MPCQSLQDSQFSPGNPGPFPGSGGFAPQQSPLNIPFTSQGLPDLSALYNLLSFALPTGKLNPHFEPDFLNTAYAGINSVLEKFMPFLMLYKFFLPVLNLILCIIEVLCAIANPFKLIGVMIKLFTQCIPEFLLLFPFFALVLMVISLLALILALITYILQRLLTIIEVILANIAVLAKATERLDNDSILSIVNKIGALLCLFQNLFVIFNVIASIVEIVKAMLGLNFGIPPCDDGNTSTLGCCTPDVCPSFIKNNTTITSSTGNFLYYNEVGLDSGLSLPAGFPPIVFTSREESWQFYDPNLATNQAFINITKAFDLPAGNSTVFFPSGTSYTNSTSVSSVPYTITFQFFYNPSIFGANDPKGPRYMQIQNAIVVAPPTAGVLSYDGKTLIAPFNGTLNLIGGLVAEMDGTVLTDTNGNPIYMNEFIHLPINNNGDIPTNNGILFPNLTYTFTINHEVLLGASLITLGCIPAVSQAKNFIAATIGNQFNMNQQSLASIANQLPDVASAQQCVANAFTQYTQSISTESTNTFQNTITGCLNTLSAQTTSALTAVITAGFDQYNSSFTISPTIQFTTSTIQVSVSLNESSGQLMTTNIPSSSAAQLAESITATVSLGSISNFAYDGYQFFNANISSSEPGNGNIQVAFNNNYISILNNPADQTQPRSVVIKQLTYTFVQSSAFAGQPMRDASDISRDNNGTE